jgi:hypothetical protein
MNINEIRGEEITKMMIEYFGEKFMESNDKGTLKQYQE